MQSDDFPEAGAVGFFSYKRLDGFIINLTLRDKTGKEVLERIEGAIKVIKEQGGLPYERSNGFPKKQVEYVPNRICPQCGSKLVYAIKKDGSKFIKCETNKWNKLANKAEGCPFIEWPKPAVQKQASENVEDYFPPEEY